MKEKITIYRNGRQVQTVELEFECVHDYLEYRAFLLTPDEDFDIIINNENLIKH